MRSTKAVVKSVPGEKPVQFKSLSYAARQNGGINPGLLTYYIQKKKLLDGALYCFLEDWHGEQPLPADDPNEPPEREPSQVESTAMSASFSSNPDPLDPEMQAIADGLGSTPQMNRFSQACKAELAEGLPSFIVGRMNVKRRLIAVNSLVIACTVTMPRSSMFISDRDFILKKGWIERDPKPGSRDITFGKERLFEIPTVDFSNFHASEA